MSGNGPTLPLLIPISGLAPLALPVQTTDQFVIQRGSITYNVDASVVSPVVDVAPANEVLAGPTSGSPAFPSFRALVSSDIPSILNGTSIDGDFLVNGNTLTFLAAVTLEIAATAVSISSGTPLSVTASSITFSGSGTFGTSSANKIVIAGAVTSSPPTITASGSDTDIDIRLVPKGIGAVTTPNKFIGIEFQIDSAFYLVFSGPNPIINFDATDFFAYDRVANQYDFYINSASRLTVSASGISGANVATNNISATGTLDLTATGDITISSGSGLVSIPAASLAVGGGSFGQYFEISAASSPLFASGPTWTSGSGVPSSTQPKGSLYSRTGGAVGSTLYVSQGGGVWNPVAGV